MRLFYREVARGNFWVGKDVFDPDIEWEWSSSLGAITGSRTYPGFDEVSAATKDSLRSFEWFRIELEELVDTAWRKRQQSNCQAGSDFASHGRVHPRY